MLALISKDAIDKGTDILFAVDDFVIEPSAIEEPSGLKSSSRRHMPSTART